MSRAADSQEPDRGARVAPSGIVTFFFSDIEGSTKRWEANRDAMDAALRRHDEIVRSAIERKGGYVFKTVGDAFCAAFARVSDAVAATIDVQAKLYAEDFSAVNGVRVRIALHTGESIEREGDYFGPAVNRAARLMSVGHGGQVLLSNATHELLRGNLPDDAALQDLGIHRLKDLSLPEQIWQLNAAGLPTQFAPLASLDARPNNLPIQSTSFRGRERDLADVSSLLGRHRLLTLFGSGGIGKTRLALQVGADLAGEYPDGVWFIDFASVSDPQLTANVAAQTLGVTQGQDRGLVDTIVASLARKRELLIFDNCEHVVAAAASLADAIVRGCPQVRILATSRQALGVAGEAVHQLHSLAVPPAETKLSAESALGYGAVALFVDRASAADTRFAFTDDNATVVAEICRRLDGIALAVELAAARVKVLTIPNLARRLSERFKLLTGGSRTALPRQQTLVALIDWSFDLLTPEEQSMFSRAAIFAGGFTLEAAAAVCGDEGVDEFAVLDLLSSLVDKSLLVADRSRERERYRMLESTREFGLEKLAAAGERAQYARKHAEYFGALARDADAAFDATPTQTWLAQLEPEFDNLRAGFAWSLEPGNDVTLGAQAVGSMSGFWRHGGFEAEGRHWIERFMGLIDETNLPAIKARLWRALAVLTTGQRSLEAAQEALRLYELVGDQRGIAHSLHRMSLDLVQIGKFDEANACSERSLEIFRSLGDEVNVAMGLMPSASMMVERGDFAAARARYLALLETPSIVADAHSRSIVLSNFGEMEFAAGDSAQALHYATQALDIERAGKSALNLALQSANVAAYRIALGDLAGARSPATDALRWAREAQSDYDVVCAIQHFALLHALRDDAPRAARLMGFVDQGYRRLGQTRERTEAWSYDSLRATLNERLSEAAIAELTLEGSKWSAEQAADEALG